MKTTKTAPQTREFFNGISNLRKLHREPYRKIVHVIGHSAALLFFIQLSGKWVPLTGSDYCHFDFSFNELPNCIKRHIDPDLMQEYMNDWAIGSQQYPTGIYFENGEIVKLWK